MSATAHIAQADELIARILTLAEQLAPSEGFHAHGFVLAKTKSGNLRVGFGDGWYGWHRGDTETLLREHLRDGLNWHRMGYYAGTLRREVETFLASPRAYTCTGVGRDAFRFDRAPGRRLS